MDRATVCAASILVMGFVTEGIFGHVTAIGFAHTTVEPTESISSNST